MPLGLVHLLHSLLSQIDVHMYDICRAFRAASPEVQQAVLGFHAPVDGPKAVEMRRLLTGPEDAVEQSIKVGLP